MGDAPSGESGELDDDVCGHEQDRGDGRGDDHESLLHMCGQDAPTSGDEKMCGAEACWDGRGCCDAEMRRGLRRRVKMW